MYQIAINDPNIYMAGEAYAKERHSSLDDLVNEYVASIASIFLSKSKKEKQITLADTEEFKAAMQYMDSFVADDFSAPVSVDEDGNGALSRIKYGV